MTNQKRIINCYFFPQTISNILRDVSYHEIDSDQLKILLLYAEQDVYDTSRQATAFTLLKVILRRKIKVQELHELMQKIAALSITSNLTRIRTQARQTTLQYMMDYLDGKKLEDMIGFFLSQLGFEMESGRKSALEMVHSFTTSFPEVRSCISFALDLGFPHFGKSSGLTLMKARFRQLTKSCGVISFDIFLKLRNHSVFESQSF